MDSYINISEINRQKILLNPIKTIGFEENNHTTPQKYQKFWEFSFKWVII